MKARRSHDVVLRHTDGSSNEVGINLWRESPQLPGGYVQELLTLHPENGKDSQGQSSYDDTSPNLDLVFEQNSWHKGLGQTIAQRRGVDDSRYAYSNGVLTQFEGQMVSGYYEDVVDILLKNPRFENAEEGASTGWTASNVTLSTDRTNQYSDDQCLGITVDSNNGTVTQRYGSDATLFRGQSLTLRVYAKRLSGSGTIRANLIDSAGTTNGSTSSPTSYTQIEVTRSIDAGATTIDFQFEFSNATDTWVIDHVSVLPPGSSVDFNDDPVTLSNELYVPCGRMVLQWDDTDDAWYAVYVDAAYDVECIAEFDPDGASPTLLIGFSSNQAYKVSTCATPTDRSSLPVSRRPDFRANRLPRGSFWTTQLWRRESRGRQTSALGT